MGQYVCNSWRGGGGRRHPVREGHFHRNSYQVKIAILTTGMAISPTHFIVVVVSLNSQKGVAWVVGFAIKGRGGSH